LTWINRDLERAGEMIVLAAGLLLKAGLEKQRPMTRRMKLRKFSSV
jgi:hypothetical protein